MPLLYSDFVDFRNDVNLDFGATAQKVYRYQYDNCYVYRKWVEHSPAPKLDGQIYPYRFLPISFFKSQPITSLPEEKAPVIFRSSGTTDSIRSQLPLYRPEFYKQNTIEIFQKYFGKPISDFRILALLPGYLRRDDSSLVHMVREWMEVSPQAGHGFFLHQTEQLLEELNSSQPTLLIGVTFALIELAEKIKFPLKNTLVIETGGMKGKGEEWTKSELHEFLHTKLGSEIYSEYGMTELLSQGYMKRGEHFLPASTMRVLVRDENDPLNIRSTGRGAINIIDLADMDTVSFIATDDLGYVHEDGSFEILGRLDSSEIRGCSQMYFEF